MSEDIRPSDIESVPIVLTSSVPRSLYVSALVGANRTRHRQVSSMLKEVVSLDDCVIATLGSDGRCEKGPYQTSKMEFIVLTRAYNPGLAQAVGAVVAMNPAYFDQVLDVRVVGKDWMSFFLNDSHRVYPSRIFDAVALYGDPMLLAQAKRQLFDEFAGPRGRDILERARQKKSDFKKYLCGVQKHKGQEFEHYSFDGNSALAFFNPPNQMSFKMGPLRYVQFAMVHNIIKAYRKDQSRYADLAALSTNMAERIMALGDVLPMSSAQRAELSESYNFFVWAYNHSQELYQFKRETVGVFDAQDVRHHVSTIERLLS